MIKRWSTTCPADFEASDDDGEYSYCRAEDVAKLEAEVEKLRAFKAYVHQRLDDAGVPVNVDPVETLRTGCRVEGRLSWLIALVPHWRWPKFAAGYVSEAEVNAERDRLGLPRVGEA